MTDSTTDGLPTLAGADVVAADDKFPTWDESASTTKGITYLEAAIAIAAAFASNGIGVAKISSTELTEYIQDVMGSILADSTTIDWTYNDAGNSLTEEVTAGSLQNSHIHASAGIVASKLDSTTLTEFVQDVIGALLSDGVLDYTYNDGANTFTITIAAGQVTRAMLVSALQPEVVTLLVSDPNGSAISTGDGKAYWRVPSTLNGLNLTAVAAHVTTVSSSGTPTIQIHNVTDAQDMLSTRITIDANEKDSSTAAAAAVINTSFDDVATGDELRIDIDVAGTGTKGLMVEMQFS